MMRREKIIYSALSIAVAALALTVANLYVLNNNQNTSLDQEQAAVLSTYAKDLFTQTHDLVQSFRRYYDFTQGDQTMPNMTENTLIMLEYRSFILLNDEANSALDVIQTDTFELSSSAISNRGNHSAYTDVYNNVSQTVSYAVNQLDWTNGRLMPSEHQRLMYELCHILGADGMPTENTTQLTQISYAFSTIYALYWNSRSQNQPNQTVIDTELAWALGNSTQLYQNLLNWHNQNPQ
jgi:hypothetical protein